MQVGRVVEVEDYQHGSELTADAAAGALVLTVADAYDFGPASGTLTLTKADGSYADTVAYSSADPETDTIALTAALPRAYLTQDRATLSPDVRERLAQVLLDDDDTEPVSAVVPHALYDKMTLGVRTEGLGELVAFELIGEEWRVANILGLPPSVDAAFITPQTITPDKVVASFVMASVFKTALTGQRLEFDVNGIRQYDSTGVLVGDQNPANGQAIFRTLRLERKSAGDIILLIKDNSPGSGVDWVQWRSPTDVLKGWIDSAGRVNDTTGFYVYGAVGDANAGIALSAGPPSIYIGPGGGTAADTRLIWIATKQLQLDDGSAGAADLKLMGQLFLGTTSDTRFRRSGAKVITADDGAAGAADLKLFGDLLLGTGSDARVRRTAAGVITFDNGGAGAADLKLGTDLRLQRIAAGIMRIDDGAAGIGVLELTANTTAPAFAAAGFVRLYILKNGANYEIRARGPNTAVLLGTVT